jgi:hypothetical protein
MKELACANLLTRFFYYLDERRYELVVSLFASNGAWLRQGARNEGAAEILKMLQRRSDTQVVRHVVSNLFLEVAEPGVAVLKSYVTAYLFDSGKQENLPVTIRSPFRLFVATTKLQDRENKLEITEHLMEPVFEFNQTES